MFFIGWALSSLFVARLGDLIGRKKVFVAALLLQVVTILILINSTNLHLSMAGLFLMGVSTAGRMSVGFFFLIEQVPKDSQGKLSTSMAAFDATAMIWATIYFSYFSHNSVYWESFALLLTIVSLTFIAIFVPESPKFLYEKRMFREAREVLNYIADKNGVGIEV